MGSVNEESLKIIRSFVTDARSVFYSYCDRDRELARFCCIVGVEIGKILFRGCYLLYISFAIIIYTYIKIIIYYNKRLI